MAALVFVVLLLALAGVLLAGFAALPLVLIVAVVAAGVWIMARRKTPTPH